MDVTKHLKKKFITGLFVLIPLLVTIYIIYIVISFVDTIIAPVIRNITFHFLGKEIYIPGTGLFLFVLLAYVTGVFASNYIGNRFLLYGEKMLRKIPFVKGIYSSVKDMTDSFSSEKRRSFKEVVFAEFPSQGRYAIGFVTNRMKSQPGEEFCSVFIPTTPNPTSGFLILIPEKELIFLDLPVDDALKYIISLGTAGIELVWKEKELPSS
jgi:uncharacterized membrane protein